MQHTITQTIFRRDQDLHTICRNWSLAPGTVYNSIPASLRPNAFPSSWSPTLIAALRQLSELTPQNMGRAHALLETYYWARARCGKGRRQRGWGGRAGRGGRQARFESLEVVDVRDAVKSLRVLMRGQEVESCGGSMESTPHGSRGGMPDMHPSFAGRKEIGVGVGRESAGIVAKRKWSVRHEIPYEAFEEERRASKRKMPRLIEEIEGIEASMGSEDGGAKAEIGIPNAEQEVEVGSIDEGADDEGSASKRPQNPPQPRSKSLPTTAMTTTTTMSEPSSSEQFPSLSLSFSTTKRRPYSLAPLEVPKANINSASQSQSQMRSTQEQEQQKAPQLPTSTFPPKTPISTLLNATTPAPSATPSSSSPSPSPSPSPLTPLPQTPKRPKPPVPIPTADPTTEEPLTITTERPVPEAPRAEPQVEAEKIDTSFQTPRMCLPPVSALLLPSPGALWPMNGDARRSPPPQTLSFPQGPQKHSYSHSRSHSNAHSNSNPNAQPQTFPPFPPFPQFPTFSPVPTMPTSTIPPIPKMHTVHPPSPFTFLQAPFANPPHTTYPHPPTPENLGSFRVELEEAEAALDAARQRHAAAIARARGSRS
ncbi:hypothetical protein CC80DRAFT_570828 [Byssothecium circinans]|uniref:Uncharacterized protein n=1 Tax=Byssothecium circinans TaxID=147558 RepID=A0A6A5TMW2_9PLEO|nr:hypothetical protein CC80DRAFT_570828 [Byssothecium circinans]